MMALPGGDDISSVFYWTGVFCVAATTVVLVLLLRQTSDGSTSVKSAVQQDEKETLPFEKKMVVESSIASRNKTNGSTATPNDRESNEKRDSNNWRCACEGGFLPPGLLKSFGGAESMIRLGTGQCYHKQM